MVRVEEGSGDLNEWHWVVFLSVLVVVILWIGASIMTMFQQEVKSFRKVNFTRLMGFNFIWMSLSLIFSIVTLPAFIFGGWKKVQKTAQFFSNLTAKCMCFATVGEVVVRGKENLPSEDTPCVVIANHQSCADIGMAYFTEIDFRWVAKWTAFCLPGVGLIMLLNGHVPLLRRTKRGKFSSKSHMLSACRKVLQDGKSVWIFPQGTRDRYNLLDFKHGAFTLAIDEKVPIVPVTIDLPSDLWFNSTAAPMMTIHSPIYPDDPVFKEKDVLMKKCFHIIIGSLSYGPELLKLKEKREEQALGSSRQDGKKQE